MGGGGVWASGRVGGSGKRFVFDKESIFFFEGGGVLFYKLTRNPNVTIFLFWGAGGGGGGGDGGRGEGVCV